MLQLVSFVALVGLCSSHNWVNSPSRAGDGTDSQKASTVKPAPASPTGDPIVQVNPGQDFQIEWVIGHNRHTYWTWLAKKDADKMEMHTDKLLDDYMAGAPAPMNGPPDKFDKKYSKYHRKANMDNIWDPPTEDGVTPPSIPDFFARRVPETDPYHVRRDARFKGSFRGARNNRIDPALVYQFEYKPADQASDRWCMYNNPKYPWIIGAARYLHVMHQPSRPDFALFKLPADADGEYIFQYRWSGYYDAVDVIVIGNPVSSPYGMEIKPGDLVPPSPFARIDHCWYPKSTLATSCIKLTAPNLDPEPCIRECRAKLHEECNGVVVIPIKTEATVYKGFRDITQTPFGMPGCNKPAADDPATHMCYGLKSRAQTALDFEYWATQDAEDPAFYATCWHRKKPVAGFTAQASTFEPVPWEYRGKCISCADRRKWSTLLDGTTKVTPYWKLESTCVNCERKEKGVLTFDPTTIHYLPFEEGTGKDAVDAIDQKSYKLAGGASFVDTAAVGNGAVKFGGSTADYIDWGSWSVSGNQFSMAAWVNFAAIDGNDPRVLSKTSGDNGDQHIFMLSTDEPTEGSGVFVPRCRLKVDGTTHEIAGTSADQPKRNAWQHWACTYDGASLKLYLDGKLVASEAGVTGSVTASSDPVIVGANTANGVRSKPMQGMVDDVRVLTKALTAAEINELIALKN